MEKGLVHFAGKSDLPGKPMFYGTTKKFMELFGLRTLEELPSMGEIDELMPDGIGELEESQAPKRPQLSVITDSMSQDTTTTYSQGEEELEKISDLLGQIDTSTEFLEQERANMKARQEAERAQNIREALAVGEVVPEKELSWLARFDAKMLERKEEAQATSGDVDAQP
jgi:segregation and condensation protein B